ncbi:class I SAM-dependent methyltransferase [Actinoplanes sp. NPDC026670]|uniref:class I SAM-dependent methyltransferase n=1 Tax=Actinoplanes sp. NPDC026670 TaxID=3154700 RepID=UPI0033C096A5
MSLVVGDAFGDLLKQCWAGQAGPGVAAEVIERDDGFTGHGDAARYFQGPEFWPDREVAFLGRAAGRILDIGCGAGRHMAALRDRGAEVQGIDPSLGAVTVCRERGLAADVGDIDHLPTGVFDTLLLLGGNLALLGSPEAASRRLAAMAAAAHPETVILGSNIDPYQTENPDHTGYHLRNIRANRPGGQLRVRVRHDETVTDWFDYWLASVAEFDDVVAASPWRFEEVDGGRPGDPLYCAALKLR